MYSHVDGKNRRKGGNLDCFSFGQIRFAESERLFAGGFGSFFPINRVLFPAFLQIVI